MGMINKIRILSRHMTNSFLFKMIVSYSCIIILMLTALTFVLTRNYSEDLKQDEINYENQIIRRVADDADANIEEAKQIIQQIYLSESNLRSAFYKLLGNTEDDITLDYYKQRNVFKSMFESAVTGKTDLIDIVIYKTATRDVLYFTGTSRKIDKNFDFDSYEWFANASDNYGIMRLVPSYIPGYIRNDQRPVYSVYAGFMNSHNSLAGVIIFNFDARSLQRSYFEYKDKVKGSILLTNKSGDVFYDSEEKYYGKPYPYYSHLKNSNDYIQLDNESIVVLKETENSLVAVGIVPKAQILERINLVIRTIYLVMTLCIAVSFVLVFLVSLRFSKRVKAVNHAMKEVEKGNLKKRIHIGKGNDEVVQINRNFNRMCERLEGYIEKVYLAEIKAKDAQLTALQTQINPHFLYNTLEAIRMKAIVNNDEDVSEMIYILANLFRNSVANKDMIIRVEDEVNYCKSYLELHTIRLGNRLMVEFDIDERIRDYAILKLILQPLIENSLVYGGIYDNMNSLTISINGYIYNETIYISVTDNGMGMGLDELNKLRTGLKNIKGVENSGSIGLSNINDRIKIFFGNSYGLEIASEINAYTKVTVSMPALTVEEVRNYVQNINSG